MKIDRELLRRLPLALRFEIEENLCRKDFLPSELAVVWRAIEAHVRTAAKKRQREHGGTAPGRKHSGKLSTSDRGKTRDKIGALAGVSGRTLEKITTIVAAAKAEPKLYGKLVETMDRTGRVNGVFKRLCILRQAKAIRAEPPPLPGRGPYRVIVADPPWLYEVRAEDPSHTGTAPYPMMAIPEICAIPVASIAAPDCFLWLWTTNAHMRHAFQVLDAWGFEYKSMLTWAKNKFGTGEWLRGQTEHCLLAIRGKPTRVLTTQSTLLSAPARRHSEKPRKFYELVETLCPAPRYCYLFSRYRHNNKWDCHGDQAPRPATEAAE